MKTEFYSALADICAQLSGRKLPRWQELPDLELYMDQVLALIARYLDAAPKDKGLTASMVNNYVKLGIIQPPVRKKYTRTHLVYLIVICVLKPVLPIPSIRELIDREREDTSEDTFYNSFCELFENTNRSVAETASSFSRDGSNNLSCAAVFAPVLRAQAEQALALELLSTLTEPEET